MEASYLTACIAFSALPWHTREITRSMPGAEATLGMHTMGAATAERELSLAAATGARIEVREIMVAAIFAVLEVEEGVGGCV